MAGFKVRPLDKGERVTELYLVDNEDGTVNLETDEVCILKITIDGIVELYKHVGIEDGFQIDDKGKVLVGEVD